MSDKPEAGPSRTSASSIRKYVVAAFVVMLVVGLVVYLVDFLDSGPGTSDVAAASKISEEGVRAILANYDPEGTYAALKVDYPLEGSVFPPDIVSPTFLFHDSDQKAVAWLVDASVGGGSDHVYALADGTRPEDPIDERCVTDTNSWKESDYQASAKGWTPHATVWDHIKKLSHEKDARVTILGLGSPDADSGVRPILPRGSVTMRTSKDPVNAPIFYRDVPLMPAATVNGVIQPLLKSALPYIKWRLRYISKPDSPVVMEHQPSCANCHTFSADGDTLAMDMDSPQGDKGSYAIAPVSAEMTITDEHVFTWNDFPGKPKGKSTSGLFAQISPDGKHVATMLNEDVFVANYLDYKFLQTFYPTRGIIVIYDTKTGEMKPLPGAANTKYVQGNPTWSPDGKTIVFFRAKARQAYDGSPMPEFANDPRENQIKYDLYSIPYNDGKGGIAKPLEGASGNGKSNAFPRYSPDGKWIVYVQANNGTLMRPDSKLYIIPAEGGKPRLMKCNTELMNSWHSWSPNSRWMVFSSKWNRPYTQMFLTHVDENGNDTPPILIPGATAANRAVNLPEFVNLEPGELVSITTPAVDYRRHLDKAVELGKKKEFAQAETELKKSIALKDDYVETHLELAGLYVKTDRCEKAIGHYKKAIKIDPRNVNAHNDCGGVLVKLGKLDEAVPYYKRALEIRSGSYVTHGNLADVLSRLGKTREAMTHFEKALQISPTYAAGHRKWGEAYARLGKHAEALKHLKQALTIDPDDPDNHVELANVYLDTRSPAEAARHYRMAIEKAPQPAKTHNNLAVALMKLGKPEEALKHFKGAVKVDPRFHQAYTNIGSILYGRGKVKEAVEYFGKSLAVNPNNYVAHFRRGIALKSLGRMRDAASHFRKAMQIESKYLPSCYELAMILATDGSASLRDGVQATQLAEAACRATGNRNPDFMYALSAAHAETGKFDQAVDIATRALKIARSTNRLDLVTRLRTAIELYRRKRPLRVGK